MFFELNIHITRDGRYFDRMITKDAVYCYNDSISKGTISGISSFFKDQIKNEISLLFKRIET